MISLLTKIVKLVFFLVEIPSIACSFLFDWFLNMAEEEKNSEDSKIKNNFYEHGKKYWESIPPNVNGMLGGFGHVSCNDIQASKNFLKIFLTSKTNPIGHHRALDCGAGIGRVTKHLLLYFFDCVDMVEQNQNFIDESYNYIADDEQRVGLRICSSLQDYVPEEARYDVIWCQWILSHLKNEDVVKFLHNCKKGLVKNGLVIVKDNVTSSNEVEIDEDDSTLSRPVFMWRELIERSGLQIIKERKQMRFPKELYEVRMFACRVLYSA